ncbi:STM4014 family protein [Catenulispora sp. NF23]|uniref:STM4014 family protein n=1 Tax=Catenulispora pinistramenti TaxID=2705254 RepID=UPI001BA8FE1B|nr:STM4014 family protein [Catenulispora pinistramenti]MBS2532268.1 STM4014 family protein [Catenulispora pinistramenti]
MTVSHRPAVPLRFAVVGNPENRRVKLFAQAVREAGLQEPRVVPWLDVLRGDFGFRVGELVRVDSPGEDAEVARLLRGSDEAVDMYRVEGTRQWYQGFTAVVAKLERAIDDAGAVRLFDQRDVATAFDKAATHRLLTEAGVPVPPEAGTDGSESAFIKIRHGSSASGVVALTVRGRHRRAVTSAEMVRTEAGIELYNSLKIRTYLRDQDIDDLLAALAVDGLHAERWVRKASIDGRDCDLRIVTVGGRATHAVLRTSTSPMTNLHLGGQRGDLAAFQAQIGEKRWLAVLELAEWAAACFPGTHCLGIDVLPGADGGADVDCIGEVNAYGDLLPNLMGLPGTPGEGVGTYGAQVRSLIGRFAP